MGEEVEGWVLILGRLEGELFAPGEAPEGDPVLQQGDLDGVHTPKGEKVRRPKFTFPRNKLYKKPAAAV